MFDELKNMLEKNKNLQQYLFVRGFLLSDNDKIDLNDFLLEFKFSLTFTGFSDSAA